MNSQKRTERCPKVTKEEEAQSLSPSGSQLSKGFHTQP
jgi:hypothetical protein